MLTKLGRSKNLERRFFSENVFKICRFTKTQQFFTTVTSPIKECFIRRMFSLFRFSESSFWSENFSVITMSPNFFSRSKVSVDRWNFFWGRSNQKKKSSAENHFSNWRNFHKRQNTFLAFSPHLSLSLSLSFFLSLRHTNTHFSPFHPVFWRFYTLTHIQTLFTMRGRKREGESEGEFECECERVLNANTHSGHQEGKIEEFACVWVCVYLLEC